MKCHESSPGARVSTLVSHGFEVARDPVPQHGSAVMLPPWQGGAGGKTGDSDMGLLSILVPNMRLVLPWSYSDKDHQKNQEMRDHSLTVYKTKPNKHQT